MAWEIISKGRGKIKITTIFFCIEEICSVRTDRELPRVSWKKKQHSTMWVVITDTNSANVQRLEVLKK